MARCGWRCSGWDRRGRRNWRFAANAIAARQRLDERPAPLTSTSCGELWSGIFPSSRSSKLTTGVDLEKSFGPIYARGLMRQGRSAFAVLGVNAQETQSSIDAALTFGILWLDVCRQAQAANVLVEGLKMFVPTGTSALVRERMANLNRDAAKWSLFELDERHDALVEIDCADRGNVATRLVHAADDEAARERFKESIARVQEVLPNCEVAVLSAAEIVFRWRGLEFARARLGAIPGSFRSTEEIVFGVGAEERVLEARNEAEFAELATLFARYSPSLWTAATSVVAAASGEMAGVAGGRRCERGR